MALYRPPSSCASVDRMRGTILLFAILVGCGDPRVPSDSGMTDPTDSGMTSDDDGGTTGDTCANGAARWIYIVDSDATFLRFEPDSQTITSLGTLNCSPSATPFSMAVDRDANAWVLHDDGRIYLVDIENGLSCSQTTFTPNQLGFERFGMGFVHDDASDTESLYIAGGSEISIGSGFSELGSIDVGTLNVSRVGSFDGWPELTGNANGELWGFFPDSSPPSVRQINRSNAQTLQTFDVSAVNPAGGIGDTAWAFAYWGGRYYIFFKGAADTSTNIWRLTPSSDELIEYVPDTGRRIVGAGVSTCAPIDLI
jgi:hypothetical protein